MFPALGGDYIVEFDILFGGRNRDDTLMTVIPSHAVEFSTGQRFYGDTLAAAFVYNMLQTNIVTFFRDSHP
jgi:hypothetical protein